MSYRGRLIKPFLIEVERIDTAATEAAGAYDPVFKTVKPQYDSDGKPLPTTRFQEPVRVRAQIEHQTSKAQQQGAAGNVPESRYMLAMHFAELERLGLVDDNKNPRFHVNDRWTAIYTLAGVLEQKLDPPLRVTEVQTSGFGIGGRRNLCILVVEDRPTGIRS